MTAEDLKEFKFENNFKQISFTGKDSYYLLKQ